MIQYDKNGIIIQNLTEILDERENTLRPTFGDDFVISGESAVANQQLADADRELTLQELLLYIASQLDPDQAEGIWLDYICALNNITRRSATKSTIPITVNGTIGTQKNVGELVVVDESTDEYYINQTAFVIDDNGSANVTFEATSFGPITALSTSTFSLKTPSMGITSVAYNLSGQATIGRDTETDEELRLRRIESITYTASSTLSSIRSAVSNVSGVEYIYPYENDTMSVVDGIPAKAFEVVVKGGNDDEIAQAILAKKPAGIQAYGTTTKIIEDEDGNQFQVGFTRPTEVPISLTVTFTATGSQTEQWKQDLKQELVEAFNKIYNVGQSVYVYNLYSVFNKHPEITNITNFKASKTATISWSGSVAIQKKELATLIIDDITIIQSV